MVRKINNHVSYILAANDYYFFYLPIRSFGGRTTIYH